MMMQLINSKVWAACLFTTLLFIGSALDASAAEVRVGVSAKEAYVGLPVVLQIQVDNASAVHLPVLPEVDGLDIRSRGAPSQSTQIMTVNGRTTKNTSLTYVYEVVPQRVGKFRIPPIAVEANGAAQQTRPIEIVVSKSETSDLLFVDVAGKEQKIYVGQALDLTLKIWLRPFRDAERDVTLSADDMWQLISPQSSWGAFESRMRELAANNARPPAQEVLRKDSEGVEHSYYLYEIDATIYPNSPGKIDADNVHVIVDYPTALGMSRDPFESMFDDTPFPGGLGGAFGGDRFPSPFGRRLTVQAVRPVVAAATVEPMEVVSIPTAGRPADYRGAVGRYQIVTEAQSTTVKAGDPIELLIGIVGTGPMDLVQAPPIAELAELTANFKVPSEPLAGFVQDDRKVFSTTIRPRQAGVTQIPAIPFSYFDPQREEFITVRSRTIAIHVDPADTLALDAIVGGRTAQGRGAEQDRENAQDPSLTLTNDSDAGVLVNETPHRASAVAMALLLIIPPLAVAGIGLVRKKASLMQMARLFRFGDHRTIARIQAAETGEEVAAIFHEYLSRQLRTASDAQETVVIIGALRTAGLHKLAVRVERIFQAARQTDGSGIGRPAALDEMKRQAAEAISETQSMQGRHSEMTRLRSARPATGKRLQKAMPRVASLLVIAGSIAWSSIASAGPLHVEGSSTEQSAARVAAEPSRPVAALETESQRQAVLAEASQLYESAMKSGREDLAAAKQGFADAAEKYQLLINSGVVNSRLYANAANAYLQSGQRGKAIANYNRALAIDPTNRAAHKNLDLAQTSLVSSNQDQSAEPGIDGRRLVSAFNSWLTQKFNPRIVIAVGVAGWIALWIAIGARLIGFRFPWKTSATIAKLIVVVTGCFYVVNWKNNNDSLAIVVSNSVELREGDGDDFAPSGARLQDGESVELVKRRGNWLKIRSASGKTGWVAATSVEAI